MACVHHLVYSSLVIALDNMDVPLRVLFSGTTTMTLLNSALDAKRALHAQLIQQNVELKNKVEGLEGTILFNHSVILKYVHGIKQSSLILTLIEDSELRSKCVLRVEHAQ